MGGLTVPKKEEEAPVSFRASSASNEGGGTFRASAQENDEPIRTTIQEAKAAANLFREKQRLNPNDVVPPKDGVPFKKDKRYYEEMDVSMDDLELLEERIEEMERYIGIEHQDLDYFMQKDIEKMDIKCNRLEDFIKVIEDKNFLLNDLFQKYDQIENFLKQGNKFSSQCLDLGKKTDFVLDGQEGLADFAKKLKEVQQLEHYLSF